MRYVYIGLIVAAVMLVLTFKVQNLEMVTVSLLGAGFRLPMSCCSPQSMFSACSLAGCCSG